MYVRRKVFSAVDNCDYDYEDLYEMAFSEGYDCAIEEALFSDEDSSVAKGAAIGALTAAGMAGAGYGALAGGQALNKKNGKAANEALRNAKTKEEEKVAEKLNKKAREGFANKVGFKKSELDKWVSEAWNREAKEGEGKLANFAKGKGKLIGIGAGVLGAGAAAGAGINALKNKKKSEKNFSTGSKVLGVVSPGSYAAKELARLEADDEESYKRNRKKAALKGWLAPTTAANKYRKAAKMAEAGATPAEIRKEIGKIGAGHLFLEGVTSPISHPIGRSYASYQGLSHMDDESRNEAKKRTKGKYED